MTEPPGYHHMVRGFVPGVATVRFSGVGLCPFSWLPTILGRIHLLSLNKTTLVVFFANAARHDVVVWHPVDHHCGRQDWA